MSARVTVVVGGKGGAGATTLSVAIARELVRRRTDVALVDGDLSGRRAAAVLFDGIRALDAARTSPNIATANVDEATLVEMTASLDGSFTIGADEAEELAAFLVEWHRQVIVDAPQPYAAAVRPLVSRAHDLLLVIEPTLLGVTGARATQLELAKFGLGQEHVLAVVVAREGRSDVSRREIEAAIGAPVAIEIPPVADRRYTRAIPALVDLLHQRRAHPVTLRPSLAAPLGDRRNAGGRRSEPDAITSARPEDEARDRLKAEIHVALTSRVDALTQTRGVDDATRMGELRGEVGSVVGELLAERSGRESAEDAARLREEIIDEALGLGPLESLLKDPTVTEIMVNGHDRIYVERAGKIILTAKRFPSDRHVRLAIERIVAPLGRRIDESQPLVDARLVDGSRVNAIVDPLAIDGPAVTIRKFPEQRMRADDLIRVGSLTKELADLLRAAVEARLNIVVSGGTGSGKTTLLNVLSSYLPGDERIVTIEDAAELSLAQEHVVRLEARPPNIQGAGEITIRDLVRNALRMRPDRIIVGECRSGEALDMLQAMNTGHDGSLTTVHANSPRDAVARIETLVMMAGFEIPARAIREQIAGAIDLVLQTARLRDGSRKVISVCEIAGLEGDVITMQELARFQQRGIERDGSVAGEFVFTGVQPLCLRRFEEMGVAYDVRDLSQGLARVANW